jgi:hypothetical protein
MYLDYSNITCRTKVAQNIIKCKQISGTINATVDVVKESGSYIITAIACVLSESNRILILLGEL